MERLRCVNISHWGSASSALVSHSSSSKLSRGVSIDDSSDILEILLDGFRLREHDLRMLSLGFTANTAALGEDDPEVVMDRESPGLQGGLRGK